MWVPVLNVSIKLFWKKRHFFFINSYIIGHIFRRNPQKSALYFWQNRVTPLCNSNGKSTSVASLCCVVCQTDETCGIQPQCYADFCNNRLFKRRESLQRRWWQCEFTTAQAGPLLQKKMNGKHCDFVVATDMAETLPIYDRVRFYQFCPEKRKGQKPLICNDTIHEMVSAGEREERGGVERQEK